MESFIIDNIENLYDYGYIVPELIYIAGLCFWVFMVRRLKLKPEESFKMSLRLFILAAFFVVLALNNIAKLAAEYGFIALLVGILQQTKIFFSNLNSK